MCWNVNYIVLLLLVTVINYVSGQLIYYSSSNKFKKKCLVISVSLSLSFLFFFKYYNFFLSSLQSVSFFFPKNSLFPELNILLPVGISFYTFQAIGYTIDVYRGDVLAEKKIAQFALYISFFPQLVAGPIERAGHLLRQFSERQYFDYNRVKDGFLLMLWGYFQKVVIADRLAVYVNAVYNYPDKYYGLTIWLATLFFSFQIYCDFSGYTDIARGSARVLGFDLMQNFHRPYFSTSIREFWKRWHISLSTWLRDYLYISLGGNRTGQIHRIGNIVIVFLFCGLWHGASWHFVLWGGIHGFYILFAVVTFSYRQKAAMFLGFSNYPFFYRIVQIVIVFFLVCFSWVFFRANFINDAFILVWNAFSFDQGNKVLIQEGLSSVQMILSCMLIFVLLSVNVLQEKVCISSLLRRQPVYVRWFSYISLVWAIIIFGVYNNDLVEFIYFQF